MDLNSLYILLALLIALYFYLIRNFNYWKCRGLKGDKPIVFFGTLWKIFFNSIQEWSCDNVVKYGKIYGQFLGDRPVLMIADPELVRDMTIKHFHNFVDRNDLFSGDSLHDRSLIHLKGDEWRKMRSIVRNIFECENVITVSAWTICQVSPTFSSGKMRKMHPMIIDCVKRLEECLGKGLNEGMDEIELTQLMSKLSMDVIASCAFGTDIDVYNEDKPNEFVTNVQMVFRGTWKMWTTMLLMVMSPPLLRWTGLQIFEPKAKEFFKSAIKTIITNRKSAKVKRNDYLQLMIEVQNKALDSVEQEVDEDNMERLYGKNTSDVLVTTKLNEELSDDDILATSFIFFVAGYESTSALLSHVFYFLALNENCQQKLYEEVMQFDGDYSYETMAKMPYLEACIAETLRVYPPLAANVRLAAEEYTLGDTGITVPKGMFVNFETYAIHHSPEYYPEPEKWDPERFMPENRHLLTPYTYMPFGLGPRNCVGMRFGLMEAKTAITYLVHNFRFFRTSNTTFPLKLMKFEFFLKTGVKNVGIEWRNTLK